MREAGVLPNETVYVGDTKVDLDTANNAGIDCILVTWGQGNNDALLEHRTTPTVSSSKELKIVLECKNVSDGGIS
jgi:phosphoglycolate phosphatase